MADRSLLPAGYAELLNDLKVRVRAAQVKAARSVNRELITLYWDIGKDMLSWNYAGVRGDFDKPTPWQLSLLTAYNEVEPLLHDRRILPSDAGVLYTRGDRQVLWAFGSVEWPLGSERRARDVLSGGDAVGCVLRAGKHKVYVIE